MHQYIVIEGNIGAGKTTLVNKIAKDFNYTKILEEFEDNPFLADFYNDRASFAFKTEIYFLLSRVKQIKKSIKTITNNNVISDYHITKSLIFAEQTLNKKEFKLYSDLFYEITDFIPFPDSYIFLQQNIRRLISNIMMRGRNYEQSITIDYLKKIDNSYINFIKQNKNIEIQFIDISKFDFKKNINDYNKILNLINLSKWIA